MNTTLAQLAKKLPSWIYKPLAQRYVDYEYPRHIFIETTAACNLSCSYCPREKSKDHMDWGLFTKIIDEAKGYGPRSFSLHLFGEPLLYPRWEDAIKYIKKANRRNTVLLTTNGTMLGVGDYLTRLKASGVDKVLWSWRDEVKWGYELREELKSWNKFTARFIEGTYPEGEEKRWPHKELRRMHNYGGEIDTSKFGAESMGGKRYPCYHLWLAPAVAWNGKFLACCSDPKQEEIIGDINIEKISDCWKRMNKIREAHLNGQYSGICLKCDVWKQYKNIFWGHEYDQKQVHQ